jgi:hypothetical protein
MHSPAPHAESSDIALEVALFFAGLLALGTYSFLETSAVLIMFPLSRDVGLPLAT